MKIAQVATILNTVINDMQIGVDAVAAEDLSNIVDIGTAVLDYTGESNDNFDRFVGKLIDQVGKIMFVDRTYTSQAPNIMKDGWEYGSILEKVRCILPDARDNATWDLVNYPIDDGAAYPDPFELSKPDVRAKFFNSKTTYEVPITLTQVQLKSAFQSAGQMASFIAMIENRIAMKITLCNDGLIMATICNLIARKANADSNVVYLFDEYVAAGGTAPDSIEAALTDKEFLRFVAKILGCYKTYLAGASVLYNEGGYCTFTPADRLKFVVNTEFARSLDAYLYSDTYHNEFVKIPGYEEVAYWQGSQSGDRLKIDVEIADEESLTGKTEVELDGVAAVMFDDEAAAVCNQNYRITSIYNPRGEYTNYFYKWDAMYMNDTNENCVVFVLGSAPDGGGDDDGED